MASDHTHVIVGASLTGARAAETLHAEGFDRRVMLIVTEDERPYARPPLLKDYWLSDLDVPLGELAKVEKGVVA